MIEPTESVGYTIQNNNKTNSVPMIIGVGLVGYTIQNNNKTNSIRKVL